MTITIGWWIIPTLFSMVMLYFMFCNDRASRNDIYGFVAVMRLFYLIPILLIWLIYFMIAYFTK